MKTTDVMDPARAAALHATLGLDGPPPGHGDPLLPFFHMAYFWEARPPSDLGRDGHPKRGLGLVPDMGLPRRMWAGGRLQWHAPLKAGIAADLTEAVTRTTRKDGRTGPLAFVTLARQIRQAGQLCLTEEKDLVFREDPAPDAPLPTPPPAPRDADEMVQVHFDETLLFRYSALTFNGHRIHYDAAYARKVEGHGGLVVHGPLLAQLLMLKARRRLGGLKCFAFRATSAVVVDEAVTLNAKGGNFWVAGADGRLCMEAQAS